MNFEVERHGIRIIPQDKQDEAYIEDTLGLKHDGETIELHRVDAMGLGYIAFLTTERPYKPIIPAMDELREAVNGAFDSVDAVAYVRDIRGG
jgi:hypothetical protein